MEIFFLLLVRTEREKMKRRPLNEAVTDRLMINDSILIAFFVFFSFQACVCVIGGVCAFSFDFI